MIMICGYTIIAVPTGIVSAEMVRASGERKERKTCPGCGARYHDQDAEFCKYCEGELQKSWVRNKYFKPQRTQ